MLGFCLPVNPGFGEITGRWVTELSAGGLLHVFVALWPNPWLRNYVGFFSCQFIQIDSLLFTLLPNFAFPSLCCKIMLRICTYNICGYPGVAYILCSRGGAYTGLEDSPYKETLTKSLELWPVLCIQLFALPLKTRHSLLHVSFC